MVTTYRTLDGNTIWEAAVDLGTIPTALLVIGAFALILLVLRRLPPAEDDVAVVVAAIMGTPVELEPPSQARPEEPVRWRLDLLKPRAAVRSKPPEGAPRLAAANRIQLGSTASVSPRAGLGQPLGGQNSG